MAAQNRRLQLLGIQRQQGARARYPATAEEAHELRSLIQTFIRSFGLLSTDRTPCGVPLSISHAHALMVLLDCARRSYKPTQQELGQELGIDKSNVARLCSRMEAASHITQEQCSEDRRARRLSLTPKGMRVAGNVQEASQLRFGSIMGMIAPHARAGVLSALEALNSAVKEVATNPQNNRDRKGSPSNEHEDR